MKHKLTYRLFSFLLALTVIHSSLYQAYVSMYFFAYQDYIIKELCVQKDNQQGCNGKCYLMKKLDVTASQKDTPASLPESEKEFRGTYVLYFAKSTLFSFDSNFILLSEDFEYYLQKIPSLTLEKETPPPEIFKTHIA